MSRPPTPAEARRMGEQGGSALEAERLAFEAWMEGHCWALGAEWTGTEYVAPIEKVARTVDINAMMTRRMWAAWRDRAALSYAQEPAPVLAPPVVSVDCNRAPQPWPDPGQAGPPGRYQPGRGGGGG